MSTDVTAKTPAPAPPGKGGSATGDGLLQLVLDGMRRNMRQYGMLFALGLIVVLFAVWTDGDLLLPRGTRITPARLVRPIVDRMPTSA